MNIPRSSGMLLHVTSLPTEFGIGDFGPVAMRWIDLLAEAGQKWWQMLPLTPPGKGFSPYQSYSAFAGNSLLVSPQVLFEDGLIDRADLEGARLPRRSRIAFTRVQKNKARLIGKASERWKEDGSFERFIATHSSWLDDLSIFMTLKETLPGKSWTTWDRDLVRRRSSAVASARRALASGIRRIQFEQFLFFRQLDALRRYAKSKRVGFIGDIPIFVSAESADVWAHPRLFKLDRDCRPRLVAGVPPDYFSKTGQRWGNPHYDWRAMKAEDFAWWIDRCRTALQQADLVRIDHFRGFAAAWEIPASAKTAIHGRWVRAPGTDLFAALKGALGDLPFIAEDLGLITPDVEALRDRFDLPGMKILQFAFDSDADDPFLPHNYVRNCVCYTGTHDNDTTLGWFRSISREEKKQVIAYAPDAAQDPVWALLRLGWSSVSNLAIAPLQDVLGLGTRARMNIPGTPSGNWSWVAPDPMLPDHILQLLKRMTQTYGRTAVSGL